MSVLTAERTSLKQVSFSIRCAAFSNRQLRTINQELYVVDGLILLRWLEENRRQYIDDKTAGWIFPSDIIRTVEFVFTRLGKDTRSGGGYSLFLRALYLEYQDLLEKNISVLAPFYDFLWSWLPVHFGPYSKTFRESILYKLKKRHLAVSQ